MQPRLQPILLMSILLSAKNLAATTINGASIAIAQQTKVKYSNYLTGFSEVSATNYTIENTDGASGIMKCDGQATMPTSVLYNQVR